LGLAKKIGIVILLYVILGISWTLVKIYGYGFFNIPADSAINTLYRVFDIFFMPITVLLVFLVLPPPPVIY
jgi:hypothetical protein